MSTKVELAEEIFDRSAEPAVGSVQVSIQRYLADLGLFHLHILSAQEYIDLADILSCSTFETGAVGTLQMRAGLQRVHLRVELVDGQSNRFELDLLRLHAAMADEPFRAHLQIRNNAARQIRSRFGAPLFTAWSIDALGVLNVQTDPIIDFHREPILQVLLSIEVIMKQVAKATLIWDLHFQLGAPPNLSGFCAFRGAHVPIAVVQAFLEHSHARSVDLHEPPLFWCTSTMDQKLRMERILYEGHPARKIFESASEAFCVPRVGLQNSVSIFFRINELDNVARLREVTHRLNHAMSLARVADYTMGRLMRSVRQRLRVLESPSEQASLAQAFTSVYTDEETTLQSVTATPLEYRFQILEDDAVVGTQQWVLQGMRSGTEATCTQAGCAHSHDLTQRRAHEATREAQRKVGTPQELLCAPARPKCIAQLALWDLEGEEGQDEAAAFARVWRFNDVAWFETLQRVPPVGCDQVGCDRNCPEPRCIFTMAQQAGPEKSQE